MNEPIKVGDLVRVVKAHCPGFDREASGVVFVVEELSGPRAHRCSHCRSIFFGVVALGGDNWAIPLPYLRRIPPLSELEDVKREEEITA